MTINLATGTLDRSVHYRVEGWPGIAFAIKRWDFTYDWETGEEEESDTWVRVVMVGDDTVHVVEVDDLTVLSENDYCAECGQIGCTHDGRDRNA